jgi:hypothetical protein
MKKGLKIFVIALVVAGIYFTNTFIITHNLKLDLIEELKYNSSCSYSYGEKYFFIKDDNNNGLYNGKQVLKHYISDFDLTKLNTEKYTYLVAVNRKINSVNYNGRNCKLRTSFAFPETYEAIIDSEKTNDSLIRIYRMKKINIDYDYHSE